MIDTFSQKLHSLLLTNPHSATTSTPNTSQYILEHTRLQVLELFKANPEHFEVVFVANATAGIKLVLEAFTANEDGFEYFYHRDSHTSLVGARELASNSRCFQNDDEVETWLTTNNTNDRGNGLRLFAYPAQSNMNGRRLPLSWPALLRCSPQSTNTYSLLDVAALASTSPLNLSNHTIAPDFVVLSFYKMFGFPDLGALIVRKSAAPLFAKRRYFGGGTTEMITCNDQPWVARKRSSLPDQLEDGTNPVHNILALSCAIDVHKQLYGGFEQVSQHTGWLAKCLYEQLTKLKHDNGAPVCHIYKDAYSAYGDSRTQGAVVTFNMRDRHGEWISSSKVGKLAAERNIHIRAGSLCNPAGMAFALGLSEKDMKSAHQSGFRCGQENDVSNGVPMGMVRASFGAMSTLDDVNVFVRFIQDCFVAGTKGATLERPSQEETPKGSFDENIKEHQLDVLKSVSSPHVERPTVSQLKVEKRRWSVRQVLRACMPKRS
jgi:molybdenum cofactor sulfurtransferase